MQLLTSWPAYCLLPSSPGLCLWGGWSWLPSVCPGDLVAQAASRWHWGRLPGDKVALLAAELVINYPALLVTLCAPCLLVGERMMVWFLFSGSG